MSITSCLKLPRVFWAACVTLIAANLGLVGFIEFTPRVSRDIAYGDIQPELGLAYQAPLSLFVTRLYVLPVDTASRQVSSRLGMFEDGRPLGPAHSQHRDIREKAGGRFSFWDGSIIFSASDGTDPRTNGRAYSFASSTRVNPPLRLLLAVVLAFVDAAFLITFRKQIFLFLRRPRGSLVITGVGVPLVLLAALAASGWFSPIIVAGEGWTEDGALAGQIVLHALLGCLTSLGIWAAGAGISRLTDRDQHSSLARVLIPAFPIGMTLLAMLLTVALIVPHGRPIAIVLWLVCLLPLRNWRPPAAQVVAALKAALGIIPFAAAFGIWLALLWHGPTDTVAGAPTGDLSFYAGSIWSLASHPFPYIDLGYANGVDRGYFNMLYPALGAALLALPNFDPFLFLLAGGGTSFVLLSALMLHFYLSDRALREIGPVDLLVLILSVVVAARYPYWAAESIPLVFVPALTISVWWMAERGQHDYRWGIAATMAGLSGSTLSKITSAALLVPLGFTGVLPHLRKLPNAAKLAAFGVAGIFGLYSMTMLVHFIPLFGASSVGPESFRTPHWFFLLRDVGALLMIASAWLVAEKGAALAVTIGLATFLAYSWLFQINFVCAALVLGLILVSGQPSSIYGRALALAAFAMSLPALILGDPANGIVSGVLWVVCLGGAALVATPNGPATTTVARQMTFPNLTLLAIVAVVVISLGLLGVSRGSIIANSGWHFTMRKPLTPALKEIWSTVRERTPNDALIFTDQVDETEDPLGGWNTYAFSGQRQLYLSSYVTNFELRNDKRKLNQTLTTNKDVLDGSRPPQRVSTRRTYHSFYAVVSTTRPVPPTWRPIIKNSQYALYEIID
jgi:hypothetical protein